MIDKKVKGIGYLLLGLIAFAGFWLDIVILKIGPHVFGIPVAEYGVLEYSPIFDSHHAKNPAKRP